jgi:radical SAM protein with 4Fe4S-binding SPASM domain
MRAKLTVTTRCGARCATCPNWQREYHQVMDLEHFKRCWDLLVWEPGITTIVLNNTGDLYSLPDAIKYLLYVESHIPVGRVVSMTTNAADMAYVPAISDLHISFNGSRKSEYERTTGLDFDRVVKNIRDAYSLLARVGYVELDFLVWEGNHYEGCEKDFYDLWADFPGQLRVSYKVENQGGAVKGLAKFVDLKRLPCDYLEALSIQPNGQIIRCAHDWEGATDLGNLFETSTKALMYHPLRAELLAQHKRGEYTGICAACNYNVAEQGKIWYLRRQRERA